MATTSPSTPASPNQEKVGQVSLARYQELVARLLQLSDEHMRSQFETGDAALEIAPMQQVGGSHPAEELFTVEACLQRLSDDTRIPASTLERRRWVASRWPAEHRRAGVPYVVFAILAGIADDAARWAQLDQPPMNERTGRKEWTQDGAKRIVGQKVTNPVTATEKVKAIHDMATDEQVAARAVTDLLRRPEVAFQAMGDEVAKHLVNRAQIDRSMQTAQVHRRPAEPALRRVQQSSEFLNLIAACSAFVAAIGRTMPTLRGHTFTDSERQVVHAQLAKVRATSDWLESAVDTGNLSLDDGLAELLRGD